jgi:very-short-patch-repair endonuclease
MVRGIAVPNHSRNIQGRFPAMNIFICQYCGSERPNHNSWRNHERLCKNNPKRQESSFKKYNEEGAWNKGLTKETDERVRNNSLSVSKAMKGIMPKFEWSETLRKEQSERKKKLYFEFPEKHPNRKVAHNRNKMTYPEKIAFDWFTRRNYDFQHNKKIDRFYPDFVIDKIIVEIDGEYWHDEDSDKKRDLILSGLGYTIYRIKTKENIENRLEEIFRR